MSRTKRLVLAVATAGFLLGIGGALSVAAGGGSAVAETSRCAQKHICVID